MRLPTRRLTRSSPAAGQSLLPGVDHLHLAGIDTISASRDPVRAWMVNRTRVPDSHPGATTRPGLPAGTNSRETPPMLPQALARSPILTMITSSGRRIVLAG